MEWFDVKDFETPYKAIGATQSSRGERIMESRRFETQEAAQLYFNNCPGRCIVSHHNFTTKKTKIIAYKYK